MDTSNLTDGTRYDEQGSKSASKKIREIANSHTPRFYNWFASIGISRVLIRNSRGVLTTEHTKSWRFSLFCLLRLNLLVKVVYLVYLLGWNNTLDFLTVLGILIWIVLAGVAVYSDYYFAQIYPAFEIFCAFWNVQSDISEKLSDENRKEFKKDLNSSAKARTVFHTCASCLAMIGLAMQYVMDPKGISFTGCLVENDSFLVTLLLGLHEEIFLISVWYQAVAIILIPVLVGCELKICLRFLKKELNRLQSPSFIKVQKGGNDKDANNEKVLTFKKPTTSKDTSPYKIEDILFDYQCLEIVADRLQAISSFLLLITQIIYFSQITSDVFVGIQLWRVGDTVSVAFYATDCSSGMGYWFFSLYSIGRLDEQMESFKNVLISYFRREYAKRTSHLKIVESFREIRIYLGPSPILKGTAAEVIFDLFGYYILAAMW